MAAITKLAGMHFILDLGDAYRSGKIVGQVEDAHLFLIQFDCDDNSMPGVIEAHHTCKLDEDLPDGRRRWLLFPTRARMTAFLAWLGASEASETSQEQTKVLPFSHPRRD